MCIDYRVLNKQTVKDQFQLPRIDSLLERLGQAEVYPKLTSHLATTKLRWKRHQYKKPSSCTNQGHFEFLVIPFGLCYAPTNFQRLMNKVFNDNISAFIAI